MSKGQVHTARLVGQFAVQMGRRQLEQSLGHLGAQPTAARRDDVDAGPRRRLRRPTPTAHDSAGVRCRPTGRARRRRSGRRPEPGRRRGGRRCGSGAGAQRHGAAASLAIPGYDSLSASQVVQRLDGLSPSELEEVRAHEAAHRHRRTILHRVEQLLAGGDSRAGLADRGRVGRSAWRQPVWRDARTPTGAASCAEQRSTSFSTPGAGPCSSAGRPGWWPRPCCARAASTGCWPTPGAASSWAPSTTPWWGWPWGGSTRWGRPRSGSSTRCYVEPEARGVGVGRGAARRPRGVVRGVGCRGVDISALPGDRETKNFLEASGFKARLITMHRALE